MIGGLMALIGVCIIMYWPRTWFQFLKRYGVEITLLHRWCLTLHLSPTSTKIWLPPKPCETVNIYWTQYLWNSFSVLIFNNHSVSFPIFKFISTVLADFGSYE
jgi:hypothetical protein